MLESQEKEREADLKASKEEGRQDAAAYRQVGRSFYFRFSFQQYLIS